MGVTLGMITLYRHACGRMIHFPLARKEASAKISGSFSKAAYEWTMEVTSILPLSIR